MLEGAELSSTSPAMARRGLLLMWCAAALALPFPAPHEVDSDESRRVLGSSVVTSVSVIMDLGNGTKAYFADAAGRPVEKPTVAAMVGSPAGLLSPDRYEFYTFDESGELVKRFMTLNQIQSIIAGGDGKPGSSNLQRLPVEPDHEGMPSSVMGVKDVVASVQNVLKGELEANKNKVPTPIASPPSAPVSSDGADSSASWSVILPAIMGAPSEPVSTVATPVKISTTSAPFKPAQSTPYNSITESAPIVAELDIAASQHTSSHAVPSSSTENIIKDTPEKPSVLPAVILQQEQSSTSSRPETTKDSSIEISTETSISASYSSSENNESNDKLPQNTTIYTLNGTISHDDLSLPESSSQEYDSSELHSSEEPSSDNSQESSSHQESSEYSSSAADTEQSSSSQQQSNEQTSTSVYHQEQTTSQTPPELDLKTQEQESAVQESIGHQQEDVKTPVEPTIIANEGSTLVNLEVTSSEKPSTMIVDESPEESQTSQQQQELSQELSPPVLPQEDEGPISQEEILVTTLKSLIGTDELLHSTSTQSSIDALQLTSDAAINEPIKPSVPEGNVSQETLLSSLQNWNEGVVTQSPTTVSDMQPTQGVSTSGSSQQPPLTTVQQPVPTLTLDLTPPFLDPVLEQLTNNLPEESLSIALKDSVTPNTKQPPANIFPDPPPETLADVTSPPDMFPPSVTTNNPQQTDQVSSDKQDESSIPQVIEHAVSNAPSVVTSSEVQDTATTLSVVKLGDTYTTKPIILSEEFPSVTEATQQHVAHLSSTVSDFPFAANTESVNVGTDSPQPISDDSQNVPDSVAQDSSDSTEHSPAEEEQATEQSTTVVSVESEGQPDSIFVKHELVTKLPESLSSESTEQPTTVVSVESEGLLDSIFVKHDSVTKLPEPLSSESTEQPTTVVSVESEEQPDSIFVKHDLVTKLPEPLSSESTEQPTTVVSVEDGGLPDSISVKHESVLPSSGTESAPTDTPTVPNSTESVTKLPEPMTSVSIEHQNIPEVTHDEALINTERTDIVKDEPTEQAGPPKVPSIMPDDLNISQELADSLTSVLSQVSDQATTILDAHPQSIDVQEPLISQDNSVTESDKDISITEIILDTEGTTIMPDIITIESIMTTLESDNHETISTNTKEQDKNVEEIEKDIQKEVLGNENEDEGVVKRQEEKDDALEDQDKLPNKIETEQTVIPVTKDYVAVTTAATVHKIHLTNSPIVYEDAETYNSYTASTVWDRITEKIPVNKKTGPKEEDPIQQVIPDVYSGSDKEGTDIVNDSHGDVESNIFKDKPIEFKLAAKEDDSEESELTETPTKTDLPDGTTQETVTTIVDKSSVTVVPTLADDSTESVTEMNSESPSKEDDKLFVTESIVEESPTTLRVPDVESDAMESDTAEPTAVLTELEPDVQVTTEVVMEAATTAIQDTTEMHSVIVDATDMPGNIDTGNVATESSASGIVMKNAMSTAISESEAKNSSTTMWTVTTQSSTTESNGLKDSAHDLRPAQPVTRPQYDTHFVASSAPVELDPAPNENLGLEVTTASLSKDIRKFADLCNELAFRTWSTVTTKGLNSARSIVMSPIGLTSILAMVFLGARGPTSGQMNDILGLDDMVTFNPHQVFRNVTESIVLSRTPGVATAAFVRELYSDRTKGKLLNFYKDRAQQFYDGHVEEVNFSMINDVLRRRTNLLVKRQTRGKIPEYLRGSSIQLHPPLAAFSANIFQTDCSQASTEGRNGEMYFTVLPSTRQRRLVPVPAAVWRSGFLAGYDPSLDATAVALGGADGSLVSVILLLPGQQGQLAPGDGLTQLEKRLVEPSFRRGAWSRVLRSMLPRPGLEVQIPRFSHRSLLNMTGALQRMGLKDLFSAERADLRGLNGVANDLHLSDIVQVNTFSTCAEDSVGSRHHVEIYPTSPQQGRTGRDGGMDLSDVPLALRPRQARVPDAPRLRFDRPFLYVVRHNPTGFLLHIGRFNPHLLH